MAAQGLSFVAIDFETANESPASVCQVGLAKVINGELIDATSWDVFPPTGLDDFHAGNIRIHKITAERAALGEAWEASSERIHAYIGDLPVLAHNVAFDRCALEESDSFTGLRPHHHEWVDSIDIAQRFIISNRYDLAAVASILKVGPFKHHDAGDDATTAARIVIELADRFGATDLHDLTTVNLDPSAVIVANVQPKGRNLGYAKDGSNIRVADMPKPNPAADPSHPLHGEYVAITGDFRDGHSKVEAWERIASVGGTPHKSVRKDTTILVVAGLESIPDTYDPMLGTGKERKAAEYLARGLPIRFMAGSEFLPYLPHEAHEPLPPIREIVSPELPAARPEQPSTRTRPPTPSRPVKPQPASAATRDQHPASSPVLEPGAVHARAPKTVPTSTPMQKPQPTSKNTITVSKSGVKLTDKERKNSPRMHRTGGIAAIVGFIVLGAVLAGIPGIGPFLFLGALAFGILVNRQMRLTARAIEIEQTGLSSGPTLRQLRKQSSPGPGQ